MKTCVIVFGVFLCVAFAQDRAPGQSVNPTPPSNVNGASGTQGTIPNPSIPGPFEPSSLAGSGFGGLGFDGTRYQGSFAGGFPGPMNGAQMSLAGVNPGFSATSRGGIPNIGNPASFGAPFGQMSGLPPAAVAALLSGGFSVGPQGRSFDGTSRQSNLGSAPNPDSTDIFGSPRNRDLDDPSPTPQPGSPAGGLDPLVGALLGQNALLSSLLSAELASHGAAINSQSSAQSAAQPSAANQPSLNPQPVTTFPYLWMQAPQSTNTVPYYDPLAGYGTYSQSFGLGTDSPVFSESLPQNVIPVYYQGIFPNNGFGYSVQSTGNSLQSTTTSKVLGNTLPHSTTDASVATKTPTSFFGP